MPTERTVSLKMLQYWGMNIIVWCSSKGTYLGFPDGLVGKKHACKAGDTEVSGSVTGLGRSPAERNGRPLRYSCLENPMDRGA